MILSANEPWWEAEEGMAHMRICPYVEAVDREQSDTFDRLIKLSALYDPNDRTWARASLTGNMGVFGSRSHVIENVIASTVDTVTAELAATRVRPRFMTDDADWSTQRRARHLSNYAEAISKLLKVHDKSVRAFHDGALKGVGLLKIYADEWNQIRVERTLLDDIVIDDAEVREGSPKQMHQRMLVSRDVLARRFPEHKEYILNSRVGGDTDWRYWADYRPVAQDQVVAIESWYLPIGVEGQDGYCPGRHTIVIEGADLLDEEWHKNYFPFARFCWQERDVGWYGIGLAERIVGHQRGINKLNWQIDRQLDQHASPTTWVRLADANIAVKTTNRLGTIGVYKSDIPKTIHPQAVSNEIYARSQQLNDGAFSESGLSRMAAQARKPAGLDSGRALMEYRDQTTQRFAQQERLFEEFVLEVIALIIETCKDLGDDAPEVIRRSQFGKKVINWDDVDMGEVRVQLVAASDISRTPAGRTQFVIEMAQGGVISQDMARRLLLQNSSIDIGRELSMYVAALENIERTIEEIEDGAVLSPEPYQNLKMGVWRMQQEYLKDRDEGAPEEILEAFRMWIVQGAWILAKQNEMQPTDAMGAAPTASAPQAMPPDPQIAEFASDLPGSPGDLMTGAGTVPANMLQ